MGAQRQLIVTLSFFTLALLFSQRGLPQSFQKLTNGENFHDIEDNLKHDVFIYGDTNAYKTLKIVAFKNHHDTFPFWAFIMYFKHNYLKAKIDFINYITNLDWIKGNGRCIEGQRTITDKEKHELYRTGKFGVSGLHGDFFKSDYENGFLWSAILICRHHHFKYIELLVHSIQSFYLIHFDVSPEKIDPKTKNFIHRCWDQYYKL